MTKIYLCGPINGCTDEECKDWREAVKAKWPDAIDPMRRDYRGKEDESVKQIVELDKIDIMNCDVVLVNYDKPSVGTSMEILYAFERGKFVVIVADHGAGSAPGCDTTATPSSGRSAPPSSSLRMWCRHEASNGIRARVLPPPLLERLAAKAVGVQVQAAQCRRSGNGSRRLAFSAGIMKYLSVCSGIEAATVAWHPLGWSARCLR
jgi:hypothetical protein